MYTRLAHAPESASRRWVSIVAMMAPLRGALSGSALPSTLRLAVVFGLMVAMLFGTASESSESALGGVAVDANDHASEQHRLPLDATEVVAEAEESRDELEEQDAAAETGSLCAGWSTRPSMLPGVLAATWWVGRSYLGGASGLGRGPPSRA